MKWTESQDAFLRRHYGKKTPAEIATHLGRKPSQIIQRAFKFGLCRKQSNHKSWSPTDLRYLIDNYGKRSAGEIAGHLDRSVRVVHARVSALGLSIGRMGPGRVWTDEEIAYLRQHYSTTPNSVLQATLGRNKKSLIPKASSLGLSKVYKWRNKPRRRIP